MKQILYTLLVISIFLVGCSGAEEMPSIAPNSIPENVEVQEESMTVDIDEDGIADAEVSVNETGTTVTLDLPDVETQSTEFCVEGETFNYNSEEGSVSAIVMGLEMYEGKEMCKAYSEMSSSTQEVDILTKTTYYFDSEYKEYHILTSVDAGQGEPTVTTVTIIDGVVQ